MLFLSLPRKRARRHQLRAQGVARALAPQLDRRGVMVLVGGAVAAVDALEVRDYAREIQLPLRRQELRQANVLDMVAPSAECDVALERLHVGSVVIVPALVAVQLAARATDAAAMTVVGVDLAPQPVPLVARQGAAHVAVPARLRHQLDSELQVFWRICRHLPLLPDQL